jgi:hypothetical protein
MPRYAYATLVLVIAAADWAALTELTRDVGLSVLTALNVGLLLLWYARLPELA